MTPFERGQGPCSSFAPASHATVHDEQRYKIARRPHLRRSADDSEYHSEVDLLTSYSKRTDLLSDLQEALRQLRQATTDDAPPSVRSVRSPDRKHRTWALSDRLTEVQIQEIVTAFEAGTAKHKLASVYGISESSVKRLLRRCLSKPRDAE
jgi:DNA-directed RNA polymerase specialized sigma24 family protein